VSRQIVIVGAGEHARVVAEAAAASGWEPIGCTVRAQEAGRPVPDGMTILGTDEEFAARLAALAPADRPAMVLGFGSPATARRRAVLRLGPAATWAVVVHPAAWVSPSAALEPGAVVLAGAIVNTGAAIGEHAIVNSGAIVEHDVRVGAHAHVAPGAAIGGGATIGEDAFVGLNAAVRDHIAVGAGATVGMGAAAVVDVPAGAVVVGVPAGG
jgi:sugar O-acyltransferase (sialic acid O-acetyltransferase NeuD family)